MSGGEKVGEEPGEGMPGVTGDEVTKDFRIDGAARFQNLDHLCFGAIDKADILSGKIGERTNGRPTGLPPIVRVSIRTPELETLPGR